jgi:hypothetical protein
MTLNARTSYPKRSSVPVWAASSGAIGMKEKEIHKQVKSFAGVFNWIKFSFSGNAVVDNDKITKILDGIFPHPPETHRHKPAYRS